MWISQVGSTLPLSPRPQGPQASGLRMWDDTTDTMVSVRPGFPGEGDEASRWCGRQTLTRQAEGQGTSCGPRRSYQGQPLSAREPRQAARGLAKAQAGTEGTVKSVTLFSFFLRLYF